MGPGGDEEGFEAAVAIAEILLPGVGVPATILPGNPGQEACGLGIGEFRRKGIVQHAFAKNGGAPVIRKQGFIKAKVLDADGIEAREESPDIDITARTVHRHWIIEAKAITFEGHQSESVCIIEVSKSSQALCIMLITQLILVQNKAYP